MCLWNLLQDDNSDGETVTGSMDERDGGSDEETISDQLLLSVQDISVRIKDMAVVMTVTLNVAITKFSLVFLLKIIGINDKFLQKCVHSIGQIIKRSISPSINHSVNPSVDQSAKQSTHFIVARRK